MLWNGFASSMVKTQCEQECEVYILLLMFFVAAGFSSLPQLSTSCHFCF
jgi:hypothetical protein